MNSAPASPRTLPRLLMRRARLVVLAVMAATLGLALFGLQDDVRDEVAAASQLAESVALLGRGPQMSDAALLEALHGLHRSQRLRHLSIEVFGADSRLLLSTGSERLPAPLEPLLGWLGQGSGAQVAWPLARPQGPPWQIRLTSTPAGEQREAVATLLAMMGLMLAGSIGLLLSMRWNLQRALTPLDRLLSAISALAQQDHEGLRGLPAMPVTELESIAGALRQLDRELQAAREHSRQLNHKMLRLQEDERTRIAHELHDELGQRLTAMRVETARLQRGAPEPTTLRAGIVELRTHCEQLQREVRNLLAGLQPFGPALDRGEPVQAVELHERLIDMVQVWQRPDAHPSLHIDLQWQISSFEGEHSHLDARTSCLPRELALAIYRITQEALTNVARHASADKAMIHLTLWQDERQWVREVDWSVADDGVGMRGPQPSTGQGNGLAGITQRVFAFGGDLQIGPAQPGQRRPGSRLAARLRASITAADPTPPAALSVLPCIAPGPTDEQHQALAETGEQRNASSRAVA